MTFQEYIQFLQDQFVREGGHPLTEDVCRAVASFGYLKPKLPVCSYQLDLVASWSRVNEGTNDAEQMKAKGRSDFEPMVKRGTDLKKKVLTLWDQVKDLPDQNVDEIKKEDPESTLRKLYDAVRAIEDECVEFNNLMGAMLLQEAIISDHCKMIRNKQDGNDKSFSLPALQGAIDEILKKRSKATKTALRDHFNISSSTTFNKHLNALNLDDDQLDLAMRGKARLV